MNNERIDLTLFEGMKEWEVEKRPDGGYAIKTGRDNFSLEEAETIAKLPTLIAELKRCYEEMDTNDPMEKTFNPCQQALVWEGMCENAKFNFRLFTEIEKITEESVKSHRDYLKNGTSE